jgi:hypothetical protein
MAPETESERENKQKAAAVHTAPLLSDLLGAITGRQQPSNCCCCMVSLTDKQGSLAKDAARDQISQFCGVVFVSLEGGEYHTDSLSILVVFSCSLVEDVRLLPLFVLLKSVDARQRNERNARMRT